MADQLPVNMWTNISGPYMYMGRLAYTILICYLIAEVTCHGVLHTLAVTETVTGLACFTLDTPAQTVANCGSCRAQLTQHFSKMKKAETKGVRNAATPTA